MAIRSKFMEKKASNTRKLALTGVFGALIIILTLVHIPSPLGIGYVHIGDMAIYVACAFLPFPYAMISAGCGSAIADLIVEGGAIYAPITLVVKGLTALVVSLILRNRKLKIWQVILADFAGALIINFGYWGANMIFFGQTLTAIVSTIGFDLIQTAIGLPLGVLFTVIMLSNKELRKFSYNCNKLED